MSYAPKKHFNCFNKQSYVKSHIQLPPLLSIYKTMGTFDNLANLGNLQSYSQNVNQTLKMQENLSNI